MKTTIQIIDDNVALTTLLAKTLARFGYNPVVENNPLLAINTARHYLPDLILLDVMMPERDGGRVLADLRADLSLRYIPVVLLTAIARESQGLADTGGIRSLILSKPVQLKELLNTIESEIARSHHLDDGESVPARRRAEETAPDALGGAMGAFDDFGQVEPPELETLGLELPDFDPNHASDRADPDFPSSVVLPSAEFSFPERDSSDRGGTALPW